ncbi:RNA polymerase sigma factor SigM [Nocardioides houyundeii]|uniref:RNA polymerase sigma factor SigM n=1 Tax=Nocardioides houyundeii TaxID=2045452 RepID=UPI000C794B60|nr:RNA polymerase sigma factor SigM [Nocardioides houyundeii]
MTSRSGSRRSDSDLLAAHVAGDPDAFGELFARHRDRLWAVALRTMGNPTDAADGLQDGMVAAFRRAASFRGEAAVTTWLHRVVVNACLDRIRAAKVRATTALPDDLEEHAARGSLASAHAVDPVDSVLEQERRQLVLDALAQLHQDQRAALVLVDMEGFGTSEVALILGCAEGTVKSRCSRGRARLATLLGPLLGPGGPPTGDGQEPRGTARRPTPGARAPDAPSTPASTPADHPSQSRSGPEEVHP